MSKFKWLGAAAWSAREVRAGDRLPYARLIDGNTVLLRDGSLMMALQVPGLLFETEDSDALNAHAATREVMLRSNLDARFVLYHHVIRRRVHVELDGEFDDPLSAHIDARWRDKLAGGSLFINDQFVALVRRPARGKAGLAERAGKLMRRRGREQVEADPKELRSLRAAATGLIATLGDYGARLLGDYAGPSGYINNELLELLSALYNGEMRPVRRPSDDTDIGHMLPYRRASFGLDAMELRGASGADFGAMLSLKDYPDATSPGLLDPLLRLPYEMVVSESFAPAERQTARERIDLSLRRLRSADEEAMAEKADMLGARDELGNGGVSFGDHHLSVLVRERGLDALDDAAASCAAALADTGAIVVREDTNLEPAFWAQFPGNESYVVRRGLISSANMASFGSFHGFALGQAENNHWGDAVTLLETTSATPFFFNFHHGDLGNFSIIGPSGSGKTVVLNFLAAQAQKFRPRTILFDKDRGAELFVRGIGGRYDRISSGHPTGFNPLAMPDNPANRAFLRDWLGVLLKAEGPEELQLIAHAVDAAYANDPSLRRLRHFRELLAGARRPMPGDLSDRLSAWIDGGEHGWLFDNADDRLDLSNRVLGFDMTALLENPRLRTPTMMYLFHRIDERLDGQPTMILIDEGWKALDDEVFAARIRDWLKTLRKRNALVGFATQSARDALESRISTALVEQTATMIFMPNSRARAEDYCDGFGLTEHELTLIRTLPAHSRAFLVRQPDASVVVRLDLSNAPEVLTILSGRESAVRRLDALRAAFGDDPAKWYPSLTGHAWPGEAVADVGSGIAASLRGVDCVTMGATQAAFGRLFGTSGYLLPALTILLTLYVAFFAIQLLTGRSRLGVSALTPRIMTMGLVLTFATSWIAYSQVVWNLALGAPNEIASVLTGVRGNATDVFAQKVDILFGVVGEAAEATKQQAAQAQQGGEVAAAIKAAMPTSMFSPEGLLWLGSMLLVLGTAGVLVATRIALAVMIALGPLFVVLALFNGTRGLFTGWLKGMVLLALAPLFAVLGGSLMLELAVPVVNALTEIPGQLDPRAAMAFFVLGVVHVALMSLVMKIATTMVAGWSVFGLAGSDSERGGEIRTTQPPAAAQVSAAATASGGNQRRIAIGGVPAAGAANDIGGAALAAHRTSHVYAVAGDRSAAPMAASASSSRSRGVGSRFRAAPARSTEKIR